MYSDEYLKFSYWWMYLYISGESIEREGKGSGGEGKGDGGEGEDV